jgi:hypothetical protein
MTGEDGKGEGDSCIPAFVQIANLLAVIIGGEERIIAFADQGERLFGDPFSQHQGLEIGRSSAAMVRTVEGAEVI